MSQVENPTTKEQQQEEEFEEILVYVDFPDFDECSLLNDTAHVTLQNILSPTPTCKINNLSFTGQHEINLGTQLFFECNDKGTQYECKSVNVLKFKLSSVQK